MCRIKKFPGQTELSMSAEVELISTTTEKKSTTRPPIQMEFQVSNQGKGKGMGMGSWKTGSDPSGVVVRGRCQCLPRPGCECAS